MGSCCAITSVVALLVGVTLILVNPKIYGWGITYVAFFGTLIGLYIWCRGRVLSREEGRRLIAD